ncbi:MAG: type II toxin-antitoxin system RelE/ParE family toxin [Candidatus Diapherotrites archaeon]|nr:type II toxin-antitoxin system RelE/ParE family toxin [Candidatus Diapherotrites archaeon]
MSRHAQKFLDKCDQHLRDRIEERLKRLSDEAVPSDSKFITRDNGEPVYRYRIGNHRALYKVKHAEKIVLVTKIDKRPHVYQR